MLDRQSLRQWVFDRNCPLMTPLLQMLHCNVHFMHILPHPEQKRDSEGIQRTSCLSILQVHLLISSHSWIKRLFWWHFLLNTAARYTQAARTSKITPRREWRPHPFAIAACFVSTAFPIFSWSCSVPEVYLTLKTRLLGVPHQKLQRRTEKAQDIYIYFSKILAAPYYFLTRAHTVGILSTRKSQCAYTGLYFHSIRDFQPVAQK